MAALFPVVPPVVGTFLYKNHFAAMVEMVAPIALYRGFAVPGKRFEGAMTFAVLFAGMVASASRAGVVLLLAELFIAIAVMFWRRTLRFKSALSLTAAAVAVLGAAASIAGPGRIWEHFHEKNPWSVRRQLLTSTIRMTSQRPWLGYGLGTWRAVYPGFATFDSGLVANEAHNDWAEWTAEAGVPFTILMACLAIWLAKPAVQSIWGLGVLMVMVHSLVDYPIREPATGLMWFALAGALSGFAQSTETGMPRS
jgi:O-antigen ligase